MSLDITQLVFLFFAAMIIFGLYGRRSRERVVRQPRLSPE